MAVDLSEYSLRWEGPGKDPASVFAQTAFLHAFCLEAEKTKYKSLREMILTMDWYAMEPDFPSFRRCWKAAEKNCRRKV